MLRPMFRIVPDDTRIRFMRGRFMGIYSGVFAFASLLDRLNIWALPLDANTAKIRGELVRLSDSCAPQKPLLQSAEHLVTPRSVRC